MTTYKRQTITSLVKNLKQVNLLKQNLEKKIKEKKEWVYICICITDLLCCTAEANTTL